MSSPSKIILLEDDPIQAEYLAEEVIWKNEPEADLRYFDSEYSFLEALNSGEFNTWCPQYALIDLLMRYYSPLDLETIDQDQIIETIPDPQEAGVRCREMFLKAGLETKVAILTVLDKRPEGCFVIQKGSDTLSKNLTDFLNS
jgi:hypothetical protein